MTTTTLYYSSQCDMSKKIVQYIIDNNMFKKITTYISLEEPVREVPTYIKYVPALEIKEGEKINVEIGNDIFRWFEYISMEVNKPNEKNNIQVLTEPLGIEGDDCGLDIDKVDMPLSINESSKDDFSNGIDEIYEKSGFSQPINQGELKNQKGAVEKDFERVLSERKLYDSQTTITRK